MVDLLKNKIFAHAECERTVNDMAVFTCNNQTCEYYKRGADGGCGLYGPCPYLTEQGQSEVNDAVNHPAHYTYGKIECIDFILDKGLDFPLGNAVKYIVRAGHKHSDNMSITDKQIEDLKKAKKYIDFEIEHLEGKR